MSAYKIFQSIALRSIRPRRFITNFDRDLIALGEKDVRLTIQSEYSSEKELDIESPKFVLTFKTRAEILDEKEEATFTIDFATDYLFDILDADYFIKIDHSTVTSVSSALVYLDYRKRLLNALADSGLPSIKIPLSPQSS